MVRLRHRPKAATAVKQAVLLIPVCEYTSHEHCGYLELNDLTGRVLNDPTLELLKRTAVSQANAGVDIIAPSGMMDGFERFAQGWIGFSRHADSVAAKYASSYYGPFRDAVESQFPSDRRTYQMDPGNAREL